MDMLWVEDDDDADEACARWSCCCVDDMARRRESMCVRESNGGRLVISRRSRFFPASLRWCCLFPDLRNNGRGARNGKKMAGGDTDR